MLRSELVLYKIYLSSASIPADAKPLLLLSQATRYNLRMTTLYHNPKCSKSRQTLALLREHGIEPTIIEYLKTPPDEKTLLHILTLLGRAPRELMRRKEAAFSEQQLDDPSLNSQTLIAAMVTHPILIERPIVMHNNKAAVGRPPENVLEIL